MQRILLNPIYYGDFIWKSQYHKGKALLESHQQENEYHQNQIFILESRYRTLQSKIGKAYEDRLGGTIDHDFWIEQNSRLKQEQAQIEAQLGALRTSNTAYIGFFTVDGGMLSVNYG